MKASDKLIEAIKGFEGFRGTAYKCPAGVWTIGYGHTFGVKQGQKITKEKAEQMLREDLNVYEKCVDRLCSNLTQGQFDACVDFCFNLGVGNFTNSTLLRCIRNRATDEEIVYQFSRWNKAGGKVLQGLVNRRAWEGKRWGEKE